MTLKSGTDFKFLFEAVVREAKKKKETRMQWWSGWQMWWSGKITFSTVVVVVPDVMNLCQHQPEHDIPISSLQLPACSCGRRLLINRQQVGCPHSTFVIHFDHCMYWNFELFKVRYGTGFVLIKLLKHVGITWLTRNASCVSGAS